MKGARAFSAKAKAGRGIPHNAAVLTAPDR
jgi:hypothetical protein